MKETTSSLRRFVEIAANIAIVVVAVVIVVNFVWPRVRPKQDIITPSIGSTVSLSGVNWKENRTTLLMVLQKGCRYCEESVPFYRKLYDQRTGTQPRILAVIPGEHGDTDRYLCDQGVLTDGIINVSLDDVKVSATPTLLLVDQSGHLKSVWIGKLDENRQKEVMQRAFDVH